MADMSCVTPELMKVLSRVYARLELQWGRLTPADSEAIALLVLSALSDGHSGSVNSLTDLAVNELTRRHPPQAGTNRSAQN